MTQLQVDLSHRRLVIFDLDGTLIDSAADIQAALNRMLSQYGRSEISLETARSIIGDGSRILVHRALALALDTDKPGAKQDAEKVDEEAAYKDFLSFYDKEAASLTKIYPGVVDTLEKLQKAGIAMAICTNKPGQVTKTVLQTLDLARFFKQVVAGDTQPFHKPDPRMILPIIDQLGFNRADTVYVGDSEVDAYTATAARLDLILMSYGYLRKPIGELDYAAELDQFAGIADLLKVDELGR